jgi:hypothetical protein
MSQEFSIDPRTGVGTSRFAGELQLADLQRCARELWAHPDFAREAFLWDMREARLTLTGSEIRELADFMKIEGVLDNPARMAFLVSGDLEFGLIRMFEVHRAEAGLDIRVFRDHPAAVAWLTTGADADPGPLP